jgi:hypothetical protein
VLTSTDLDLAVAVVLDVHIVYFRQLKHKTGRHHPGMAGEIMTDSKALCLHILGRKGLQAARS